MINLVVVEIRLPLRTLLLIGSLIQLPGEIILSHVAWQSTLETRTKSMTSLRGGILLVQDCRSRNLLYTLPGLLHNAGDGTMDTRDATSKSWDAALGTRNIGSRIADVEHTSVHNSEMGPCQTGWAVKSEA
jgi:hypothetical protein